MDQVKRGTQMAYKEIKMQRAIGKNGRKCDKSKDLEMHDDDDCVINIYLYLNT